MSDFDNEISNLVSEDFSEVRKVLTLIEAVIDDTTDDIGHEGNIIGGIQLLTKLTNGTSVEDISTEDLILALKTYHSLAKLVKKVARPMEEALHTLDLMKKSGHINGNTRFDHFNDH